MRLLRTVRAYFALSLFACGLVLFSAPHLYALIAWDWVFFVDPSTHRSRIDRWQMYWGCVLARIVFAVMGIKVHFDLPAFDYVWPLIVVSNHPSGAFDGAVLQLAFQERIDPQGFRSIMKREVLKMPIIGRACKEAGCAFLVRGSDKSADLAEIARCARDASEDLRSVLIFPEGTRFRAPKPGSGFSRVLPPKSAGLRAVIETMPDYMVLPVTIVWSSTTSTGDVGSYVGATVRIEATRLEEVDPACVTTWLQEEWERKERRLVANG